MNQETIILVIEDEIDILEMIEYNLQKENYKVITTISGADAFDLAKINSPNLILLDIMLPDVDGFEVCRLLKRNSETENIPIVMLTAKSEESDIITGLELGADDYITKPFSPKVLIARIRAVLRRKSEPIGNDDDILHIEKLSIDPGKHQVKINESVLNLTNTEFRLLFYLARRPGWVFTRDQIVNSVRGEDAIITDRSIDVHVAGLRKKMGEYGDYIETVRGVGYRFKE
ncbi:MAG: response regulator [Candidatus Zixiibacteriota bacterium]